MWGRPLMTLTPHGGSRLTRNRGFASTVGHRACCEHRGTAGRRQYSTPAVGRGPASAQSHRVAGWILIVPMTTSGLMFLNGLLFICDSGAVQELTEVNVLVLSSQLSMSS